MHALWNQQSLRHMSINEPMQCLHGNSRKAQSAICHACPLPTLHPLAQRQKPEGTQKDMLDL